MPDVYAVFEGGGVKGIAHVGAYARVQLELRTIKGFAGSSAGAIVAALGAAGYNALEPNKSLGQLLSLTANGAMDKWPGELVQIMRSLDYLTFLDGRDRFTLEDLRSARDWFMESGTFLAEKAWFQKTRLFLSAICNLRLLERLFTRLVANRGLYATRTFLEWMHRYLSKDELRDKQGKVTFGSVSQQRGVVLKVIATDLVGRTYMEFNPVETARLEVAGAVQASMSIPFFFEPYPNGNSFLVDGGLVSNFPAWVFADELSTNQAVVLGFRLIPDRKPTYSVSTFGEYARELFHTTLEGPSFMQTRGLNNFIPIDIRITEDISATKFDLTKQEQDRLFFDGWQAADNELSKSQNRTMLGLPAKLPD